MSTQNNQHLAYIALGSNLADRELNLTRAVESLSATEGCSVISCSPFIAYAAEGARPDAPEYLNATLALTTNLSPFALLVALQRIEQNLGRPAAKDRQPNQDRLIDLDLLLYDQAVIVTAGLILPHPRMHRRRFVLEPLCRIAPDVLHPVLGQTAQQLLNRFETKDRT